MQAHCQLPMLYTSARIQPSSNVVKCCRQAGRQHRVAYAGSCSNPLMIVPLYGHCKLLILLPQKLLPHCSLGVHYLALHGLQDGSAMAQQVLSAFFDALQIKNRVAIMNRLGISGDGLKLPPWKSLDIGVKCTIGVVSTSAAAAAVCVPNRREKDEMALRLYDKPQNKLRPQEQRVTEFAAGHKRWKDFWQLKVYPITRKLPGAKSPILNPYRDLEPLAGGQDEED